MTAIVTGGSAGIGLAIVQELLKGGEEVVSLDLKPSPQKKARHLAVDLTDPAATAWAAAEIAKKHQVTTLIHNAGTIRPALLPEVKVEDLNALVNLHITAAVILLQACLPAMKAAGFGRVVLVSSRAVLGLPRGTMLWKLSVSIGPGATTFTVMPCGASSSAQVRAMPSMPALLAE